VYQEILMMTIEGALVLHQWCSADPFGDRFFFLEKKNIIVTASKSARLDLRFQ
jgi:hypothetical protein